MSYLLDACVISEFVKPRPNEKVVEWMRQADPDGIHLSVITIGEIRKGIEKLPRSKRKEALQDWLDNQLLARFEGRILALDAPVMLTWGELVGRLEHQGRTISVLDSLIAAIALHHDLRLVTRNESDFAHAGVEIVNPWI